jgi:hypothetical protein
MLNEFGENLDINGLNTAFNSAMDIAKKEALAEFNRNRQDTQPQPSGDDLQDKIDLFFVKAGTPELADNDHEIWEHFETLASEKPYFKTMINQDLKGGLQMLLDTYVAKHGDPRKPDDITDKANARTNPSTSLSTFDGILKSKLKKGEKYPSLTETHQILKDQGAFS